MTLLIGWCAGLAGALVGDQAAGAAATAGENVDRVDAAPSDAEDDDQADDADAPPGETAR